MATCDARFYFGNSIPVPDAQPEGDFSWGTRGYECDTTKGQSLQMVECLAAIGVAMVLCLSMYIYIYQPYMATNLVNQPDGAFSVPANS